MTAIAYTSLQLAFNFVRSEYERGRLICLYYPYYRIMLFNQTHDYRKLWSSDINPIDALHSYVRQTSYLIVEERPLAAADKPLP